MQISPLYKIIALSSSLAVGFLLIILSCALFSNWFPLIVVGLFLIAPLPNAVCGNWRAEDFMSDTASTVVDFGRFATGFILFSGLALPVVLAHNDIIRTSAMLMSIAGGTLVYLTIITFGAFFNHGEEY